MMIYCKTCLYPNTKPDLLFDSEGVCSACRAYEARKNINWSDSAMMFNQMAQAHDILYPNKYNCIVPVSGGKDSTYQIEKVKSYGLRPLAVNVRTCDLSELGRRNLNNISLLGNDLVEVVPNQRLRRHINRYALETIGDISWPEHVLIFTVPVIVAKEKNIPLIIWGENPQNEYGGPKEWQDQSELIAKRWLSEFGGLNGLRVTDVQDSLDCSDSDMCYYKYPSDVSDIRQIFLGSYFEWDGLKNAKFAKENGFEFSEFPVEGSGYNYENLDNYHTGLHDYFMYLKYGFGRATGITNTLIRRGKMIRAEGVSHVRKWDGQYPSDYLGKHLVRILAPLEMKLSDFDKIVRQFANKELFDVSGSRPIPKFKVN